MPTNSELFVVYNGNPMCARLMMRGIARHAEVQHLIVNFVTSADILRFVRTTPPVGVILISIDENTCLQLKHLPFVVSAGTDRTELGIHSILWDDLEAGRLAGKHLIEQGYRRLTTFSMDTARFAMDRHLGLCEVAAAAGVTVYDRGVFDTRQLGEPLYPAISKWLQNLPKPIGILAGCDSWGYALLTAARQAGVQVPEEVGVVSVDNDHELCELTQPTMSAVEVPWHRAGEVAAEMFFADPPPQSLRHVLTPNKLVQRISSNIEGGFHPEVRAAQAFIHQRSTDPIGVDDVAKHLAFRRRSLELLFRRHLGRSVLEEITRARLRVAQELLLQTDLPISTIAKRCGYRTQSQFAVAFRSKLRVSPSDLRKQQRLVSECI